MDWASIISLLNKKYNHYLVDFVGHGKSDSPKEIITILLIQL